MKGEQIVSKGFFRCPLEEKVSDLSSSVALYLNTHSLWKNRGALRLVLQVFGDFVRSKFVVPYNKVSVDYLAFYALLPCFNHSLNEHFSFLLYILRVSFVVESYMQKLNQMLSCSIV